MHNKLTADESWQSWQIIRVVCASQAVQKKAPGGMHVGQYTPRTHVHRTFTRRRPQFLQGKLAGHLSQSVLRWAS